MYTYLIRRPLSIFNLIMSINTYCYAIQGHNSYTYNVHTAYKINIALLKFIALPNVALWVLISKFSKDFCLKSTCICEQNLKIYLTIQLFKTTKCFLDNNIQNVIFKHFVFINFLLVQLHAISIGLHLISISITRIINKGNQQAKKSGCCCIKNYVLYCNCIYCKEYNNKREWPCKKYCVCCFTLILTHLSQSSSEQLVLLSPLSCYPRCNFHLLHKI